MNHSQDMRYLARRAFNSFCRAYSHLKDKDSFNIKMLNLHKISKSYGLSSAKSKGYLDKEGYTDMKDAKKISSSEINHIEMKKKKVEMGKKIVNDKNYLNDEFAMG